MATPQELADRAMEALRGEDPMKAAQALQEALEADPERLDFLHALAVTELQLGDANSALALTFRGEQIARRRADQTAHTLFPQLLLARAAAFEDLHDPESAVAVFQELLRNEPENPRANQSLGHLFLGWGRTEEGLEVLDRYLSQAVDEPPFLEATQAFADAVRGFVRDEIHPRELLNAHRGSYVEFFDHHAERMEAEGWIAEAARMHRDEDGNVVLSVPEGAPDWAGVRVDLVNPQTGQPGRVGDQPMLVGLAGYEALAQAPVLSQWPVRDAPFSIWVSSQVPWNHLRLQIVMEDEPEDVVALLEPVVADWYRAGFDGAFGDPNRGRFHEIDDLVAVGKNSVLVHIDAGRAEVRAIDDLIKRLDVLHSRTPVASLVLGRGYVPA